MMKLRKQPPVALIIFSLTALLAIAGIFSLRTTTVEAGGPGIKAIGQDASRSDVKASPKVRQTKPAKANSIAVPSNDNCAAAINIAATPFTDTKDTTGATDEASEPTSTCTDQGASVWYTLTPSVNIRSVTVSTCTSDFDTAIMVYRVTGAACAFAGFVPVACNDDFCGDGLQSTVQFIADANTTYKLQIGGFDSETGSLTTNVTWDEFECPPLVINGVLGSGSAGFTGPQVSGTQTGRLNRNGISSSCAAPKTCLIFDTTPGRAFDAYSIPNESGQAQCVSINLTNNDQAGNNLQSNAYLTSYVPTNICTNYLGDPGLSSGVPPTPTNFSVTVPAGQTLVVVVHTTNPGETGGNYTLTILGDLCAGFDYCVQDTNNPSRFIQISSTTGKYKYRDCSKNITIEGTGTVTQSFCKIELIGQGPNPKKPDRLINVIVNPCTMKGDASISFGMTNAILSDTNITNNTCACP